MLKKLGKRALISFGIGIGIVAMFDNLLSVVSTVDGGGPEHIPILGFLQLSLFYSLFPFLVLTLISLFSKNNN